MAKRYTKKWWSNIFAGQKRWRKLHPPKYHNLDQSALQNFKGMHNRVREGKAPYIVWPRTRQGYIDFLKAIGPKPIDGQRWSVGRKNHSKGYEQKNVQWELHKFNSIKRKGTRHEHSRKAVVKLRPGPKFKIGSDEWYNHQRRASKLRWKKERLG